MYFTIITSQWRILKGIERLTIARRRWGIDSWRILKGIERDSKWLTLTYQLDNRRILKGIESRIRRKDAYKIKDEES